MKFICKPHLKDLEEIVEIDTKVIGNASRLEYIKNAIMEERCIVAKTENRIVGFLIFNTHFYDYSFISLIIIDPPYRRKGYASSLLNHFVNISSTSKIFSSTNQSNQSMQEVFNANGFIKSGIIENLDEGDPEIVYFKSK
ncbi:MAG: GNAT family N-acetyltransferase [Bacillus sp. (in: Bacteria)]|nr:GNAT family N-acetyltransferase [Bacillus sp. (in: firmicutes)]